MNPWGVPSGGDWGLYRGGAIFVEGAEDITLQHNTLTRLDGNGVFVSGTSTARPLFFSALLSPSPLSSGISTVRSSAQRRFLLRLLARETVGLIASGVAGCRVHAQRQHHRLGVLLDRMQPDGQLGKLRQARLGIA